MKGSDIIYNAIRKYTNSAFIYSGGAIMPLIDKFYKSSFKTYINSNEHCTALSTVGYAKSTGKPGLCIVTSGPGITNCLTGITDAYTDSTPMVVLSGQVSTKNLGTQAFQEAPAVKMSKSVTKWSYQPRTTGELEKCIHDAFHIALSGKPGPVHIDLCKDLLVNEAIEYDYDTKIIDKDIEDEVEVNIMDIIEIAEVVNKSQKPIFILGKGCIECTDLIRDIVAKCNIPVTTTIHGMGIIDETSNLSLKFLGMHGNYTANKAVQNSDCIINLGSRFDDRITGDITKFAKKAKIIHCNIDKNDINRNVMADYSYVGTVNKFLYNIKPFLDKKDRHEWFSMIWTWKSQHKFNYKRLSYGSIKQQDIIIELDKYMDKGNTIVTSGVGNHQMYASQFIDWTHPRRFLSSGSLGVMGAGLPYAIGAQIANPTATVIDLDGDGSFNMSLSDLITVARYKLPIKMIVLDDACLSMVKVWEDLFYSKRFVATDLPRNINYCQLAESFDIKSIYCESRKDIQKSIIKLLKCKEPVLAHFKCETDYCFPLVPPGAGLDEMILDTQDIEIPSDINLPPS